MTLGLVAVVVAAGFAIPAQAAAPTRQSDPANASPLGASAARAARAGQSLFAVPEIAAIYQSMPARDSGPQWPIPQGRFKSDSDDTFVLTRVCEDAGCGTQKGVLVDVASGGVVFCSFSVLDPPRMQVGSFKTLPPPVIWRNFPGSQKTIDTNHTGCPSRVAELNPRFIASWKYTQQQYLARLQTPAAPTQPVPPLSGAEAARLARAGQSLFTIPAIQALYQGRDWPSGRLPQGRFESASNDRFAMTKVCTQADCRGQSVVVVDIAANDAVLCRHTYFPGDDGGPSPHGWNSAGGAFLYESAPSCPHRLSDLTPKVLVAWQQDLRKRAAPAATSAPVSFAWNGMQQRAQISGQCVQFWLAGVEQPRGPCPGALDISVPSREELAQNRLPTAVFRGTGSARPIILGFSRARRSVATDGTTTITYRALKVNQIPDSLARQLAGSGKSIDCTYRFARGETQGNFACGAVPNSGSFGEAFMFDIQFAPDSATYTTPVDEGPRMHGLMLAAWEALGAK